MSARLSALVGLLALGALVGCRTEPLALSNGDGGNQSDLGFSMVDSSGTALPDAAPTDLPPRVVPDAGPLACGTMSCSTGQVCCVQIGRMGISASCETSCGDMGTTIECTGPEYCGGNPCCLSLNKFRPAGVVCTESRSACEPTFDFSGSGSTRLCHTGADCTDGTNNITFPDCCSSSAFGIKQQFCFSKAYASLPMLMGRITCP